jgi:uncharacterized protein YcbK (DUF882 family)
MDWSKYANFDEAEFRCTQTGECRMQADFMRRLQALRSIEASKAQPGVHTRGIACDIAVSGREAYDVLALALKHGFTGIGVAQKGSGRFLHLDTFTGGPRPNIWSY